MEDTNLLPKLQRCPYQKRNKNITHQGTRLRTLGQGRRNGYGVLQKNEEIGVLLKDAFLPCVAVGFVMHVADSPG